MTKHQQTQGFSPYCGPQKAPQKHRKGPQLHTPAPELYPNRYRSDDGLYIYRDDHPVMHTHPQRASLLRMVVNWLWLELAEGIARRRRSRHLRQLANDADRQYPWYTVTASRRQCQDGRVSVNVNVEVK